MLGYSTSLTTDVESAQWQFITRHISYSLSNANQIKASTFLW